MISNSQIKYFRSLALKKNRIQYRRFLAEGEKLIRDLLAERKSLLKPISLLSLPDIFGKSELPENLDYFEVNPQLLERISSLKTPPSAIMELSIPEYSFNPESIAGGCSLYFEDIRDPGNLGTIIRIADWFGMNDIFCSPESVDAFNPKTIQASMGSIARVRIHYTEAEPLFRTLLITNPGMLLAATAMSGIPVYNKILPESCVLVFGNEGHGLSERLKKLCHEEISIPVFGNSGAESLNLAVSAAVFCSEYRRREFTQSENKG